MKSTLCAALLFALFSGNSHACLESDRDYIGQVTIKNGCNKPVWVAWCFGGSCTPEGDTAVFLQPGFAKVVGHSKQNLRYEYCVAPKRFTSDNRCR